MFTLTEIASLNDNHPTYRILKPWWDVLMDYLGVIMLMLAIFAMTMQLSKDHVVCLPCPGNEPTRCSSFGAQSNADPTLAPVVFQETQPTAKPLVTKDLPDNIVEEIHHSYPRDSSVIAGPPQPTGIKTNMEYQQYVFVNQVCYHQALPWYSKYFPFLALVHTIVLMVSSNFWFKYPKTSSKIEHFVAILGRCFESPWTTKALSETACEDTEDTKQRMTMASIRFSGVERSEEDSNRASPVKFSEEDPALLGPNILDKKDGEQAKALFEKVRKFRIHVEESDLIYKLYVGQTVVKTLKFILILTYMSHFVASIHFRHTCNPEVKHLIGYSQFYCTHNLAFILKKVLQSFMGLVCIYGLVCLYTLFWLFRRPLKEYSFEKVREESSFSDIPDVKNDFAFLLHMVDQYDQLYSKRFGVFLSDVSENRLREISLNHEWTHEKVRPLATRNAQDQTELHLFMLPGLPSAVFDLSDLEVLKLELIPEARFTAKIIQMTNLRELHLCHCPAKVDQAAFIFLREHLRTLLVKFTDVAEIPNWVYLLRKLKELKVIGNLNSANNKMIALESLRELKNLKILQIKSNLSKLPSNLVDLAPHLDKLVVHNDGTKLLVLNTLKKMTHLAELELHNCELERIPHAIFSLTILQKLDLKSNNFRTIEEVASFQHLKRLTCLKLWHNNIQSIPNSIGNVKTLEVLYLSYNKLEALPAALFNLSKLRYLDVSHNSIATIPPEVGLLMNLQHLLVTDNKVEVLPKQLFKCNRLKVLCLGHNSLQSLPEALGQLVHLTQLELKGNYLERLPPQLGECLLLRKSGLVVEDHLFNTLPLDVKERIGQDTTASFTSSL